MKFRKTFERFGEEEEGNTCTISLPSDVILFAHDFTINILGNMFQAFINNTSIKDSRFWHFLENNIVYIVFFNIFMSPEKHEIHQIICGSIIRRLVKDLWNLVNCFNLINV